MFVYRKFLSKSFINKQTFIIIFKEFIYKSFLYQVKV
jgi:hypothetical protein